jgi:hypothetical protein
MPLPTSDKRRKTMFYLIVYALSTASSPIILEQCQAFDTQQEAYASALLSRENINRLHGAICEQKYGVWHWECETKELNFNVKIKRDIQSCQAASSK